MLDIVKSGPPSDEPNDRTLRRDRDAASLQLRRAHVHADALNNAILLPDAQRLDPGQRLQSQDVFFHPGALIQVFADAATQHACSAGYHYYIIADIK